MRPHLLAWSLLSMVVACAAERGRPADPGADLAGARADLGLADLSPEAPGFLIPTWVFTLQGGLVSWGPYVVGLPGSGEAAPPVVALAFTKGYGVDQITVGAGDPGQAVVSGKFKPVLAWLDGRDGKVQRVRQVAGDQSATQLSAVVPQARLSAGPGGAVVMGGQFHGSAVFNPGTAAAQSQSAAQTLVGDTLHRAEDPFIVGYGADATPGLFVRGRTPGPLSMTWFNYCQGVAALPDGGAVVAGRYESGGFRFGDGSAGAVTLSAPGGSYLARVNAQGSPVWLSRNSGRIDFWTGARAAADGSAYVLASYDQGAVLLADTDKVALPLDPGARGWALIKLTPSGKIAWLRRLSSSSVSSPADFAVAPDGRVVLSGGVVGRLELLSDGGRVDAALESQAPQGFVASWGADGSLLWTTALGAAVSGAGALSVQADGSAWVTALTGQATRALPLDPGGSATLPDAGVADASVPLLYRITPQGGRASVAALGVNLPVASVAAVPGGGVVLAGGYGNWGQDIRVGSAGGTRALPPCTSSEDQTLFVMTVRPR